MNLPKVTDDPAFLFMLRVGLTNKAHGNRSLSIVAEEDTARRSVDEASE